MAMPLETYRKKRKFDKTPEPKGRLRRSAKEPSFVVQKHDASHLHCDFRLEMGGVLVSWAVPKGPSLDPASKRFATMTEDHPVEYAAFEGTIPDGHYGAGTVMIWDKGTYETKDARAPEDQLADGELKVELHGKKLHGAFVLIRMGHQSNTLRERSRWLLIKGKDKWAVPQWKPEDRRMDRSVKSGRTLDEIARLVMPRKKAA
jgi:bifunctional non-homologous end joining protein LigD